MNNDELSTPAILGISVAIALVGLVAYAVIAPVPPAVMIALGHSAVNDAEIARSHADR